MAIWFCRKQDNSPLRTRYRNIKLRRPPFCSSIVRVKSSTEEICLRWAPQRAVPGVLTDCQLPFEGQHGNRKFGQNRPDRILNVPGKFLKQLKSTLLVYLFLINCCTFFLFFFCVLQFQKLYFEIRSRNNIIHPFPK